MNNPLQNSSFLKACRGEKSDFTPVWFMRQAGRYMREYRQDKARAKNFLDFCKTPELTAKVTLDAQKILGVDAAILFSDLPLILEPMGLDLDYPEGVGPSISNPVRVPGDVDKLREFAPSEAFPFVGETIRLINSELQRGIPLIGFSGAPFTVGSYAIEGRGSKEYQHVKNMMFNESSSWHKMMDKLANDISAYLNAQIDWGVHAVQIFDSWVGCLSPEEYSMYALPYTKKVIDNVKGRVPIIHFGTGAGNFMDLMDSAGAEVLGFDWLTPIRPTWDKLNCKSVQGNLDPSLLFEDWSTVKKAIDNILENIDGKPGHIFNLGHGILPGTPVDMVKKIVEYVHEKTADRKSQGSSM